MHKLAQPPVGYRDRSGEVVTLEPNACAKSTQRTPAWQWLATCHACSLYRVPLNRVVCRKAKK
jgi:hypothetical protein